MKSYNHLPSRHLGTETNSLFCQISIPTGRLFSGMKALLRMACWRVYSSGKAQSTEVQEYLSWSFTAASVASIKEQSPNTKRESFMICGKSLVNTSSNDLSFDFSNQTTRLFFCKCWQRRWNASYQCKKIVLLTF